MFANVLETLWILFIAVVVFKMSYGETGVKGLLKGVTGATVELERVPLVALSPVGIGVYVFPAVANLANDNPVFPDAPAFLLWTLIVSQLLYVVGKLIRTQQRR